MVKVAAEGAHTELQDGKENNAKHPSGDSKEAALMIKICENLKTFREK